MEEVLVQDISGNRWIFSCNSQQELYYQINQGAKEILQSHMSLEFDAVTGADGHIHIAAQDMQGTLIYLCYDFQHWRKYPILQSKSGQQHISQIRLLHDGTHANAFYILQHNQRHMLVHHAFGTDGLISTPEVIGYVHPSRRYCLAANSKADCRLYYFDQEDIMCCKSFRLSDRVCQTADLPMSGAIRAAAAIYDSSGTLHTACLAQQKSYYTISYCREGEEPKLLSFGVDNIAALAIFVTEKRISIQWQERYNVYECVSKDGGTSFLKPLNLSATKGSSTKIMRVRLAANPLCLQINQCACIGTSPLNTDDLFSASGRRAVSALAEHRQQYQSAPDRQQQTASRYAALQAQLSETQKNLQQLQGVVSSLLNRIEELEQAPAPQPPIPAVQTAQDGCAQSKPPELYQQPPPKTDIDSDKVGEIDQENYQLFQQMSIDDVDFSSGKIF